MTPASPERRGRSAGVTFAISFLLGVAIVVGAGGAGLYAYGAQYTGRVLRKKTCYSHHATITGIVLRGKGSVAKPSPSPTPAPTP